MTTDVQPAERSPEPPQLLLDAARRVTPDWLRMTTISAAARGGVVIAVDDPEIAGMADAVTRDLLVALAELLATDVDEQRTNPLSLFRDAVRPATELLRRRGVRLPAVDDFAADHFPDDPYRLGPATWSDVHTDLHEPGITWGAWKAMTVLRRRRDDGLR